VGAFAAYSKRETLRLASELNRARAEGAESFDKLDTCIASHQIAQHEAQVCKDALDKERREYKSALDHLSKSDGVIAERARELATMQVSYTAKLKTCEDDANRAQQACIADRARVVAECDKKQTQLVSDRDDQKRVTESRTAELDRCRMDLASSEQRATALTKTLTATRAAETPGGAASAGGLPPLPTDPGSGSPTPAGSE
jgi:hypothetical protein